MEDEVFQLLQQTPDTPYSVKMVGKFVDREQFKEDPSWARPILERLAAQKLIIEDQDGCYYFAAPKGRLGTR